MQDRFPEKIVIRDDDARARRADAMKIFQAALHVVEKSDEVGDDDVIKFLVEFEVLDIADSEFQMRIFLACGVNHVRADVDAEAAQWLEGVEQLAGAATDFEHGTVLGDVERKGPRQLFVVVRVLLHPAFALGRQRVEVFDQRVVHADFSNTATMRRDKILFWNKRVCSTLCSAANTGPGSSER